MTGRLENQRVLITGAASGLGAVLVARFIAEGAQVVAFDRSAERLAELEAKHPGIGVIAGDVRSVADNEAAVALAVERFGGLDTFVGNAGVWDFNRGIDATPAEELANGFDELFAINVKGYLLGVKASLEALKASGGQVVLTLSNSSFYPGGGGPLYIASKHAAVGLVRELAFELLSQVRVNAVAPGGMATDLRGPESLGLSDTNIVDSFKDRPVTLPQPEQYADAYVLLASSKESSTINGTVIDASGHGVRPRAAYVDRIAEARGVAAAKR